MDDRKAELPEDGGGRQYHIGAGPGDLAQHILLVGDPDRADRAGNLLGVLDRRLHSREFHTYTGRFRGLPVSVMSTGIGCDNMEIAVVEICQVVSDPVILRVGSCGALHKSISLGDLVISTGAVRLENTSTFFVPEGFPAVAHYKAVAALTAAAEEEGVRWHAGITASGSGFYGAQGRAVPGFRPRFPGLLDELADLGVLNFEMEASTLFTLASIRGFVAGCVCAVYANRPRDEFIAEKLTAEAAALRTGLGALVRLAGVVP